MTSNAPHPTEAFVWVWLPDAIEPVVAGRLFAEGDTLRFNYGQSYLKRENAISLFEPELPLREGVLPLLPGLAMPSCLRDGAPDAWGRRVIINRMLGTKGTSGQPPQLDELTYLLQSGSDRIGALDFQASPSDYVPRSPTNASLDELLAAADLVERGVPLTPELDQALHHGTSIGGARPKALIEDGPRKYVAKFSSGADIYSVVKGEFIAMRLAQHCGLSVASVWLQQVSGKDILLIERFDRTPTPDGWGRKSMVSALTLFGLDEMMARYASYQDLAEIIRHKFTEVTQNLHELFARMVFNILVGNTDDHARNHSAFWDGRLLTLTPAYDICPQPRTGNEATQAMLIHDENRLSQIATCLDAASDFRLSATEATEVVERQIMTMGKTWNALCEEAELPQTDRALFAGRQFLNPFAFENLPPETAHLQALASDVRRKLPG
jgi:serine/threonine-protein kinase HipA